MKRRTLLYGLGAVTLCVLALFMTGCAQPFDTPEIYEITPSQTAFLVPMEGQTSNQGTFQSEDFLKKAQVATKRIQIPHRWLQTGRAVNEGKYIPTMKLIVVERQPVVREWTSETSSGTSATDQGIKGGTKDGFGFSANVNIAAQIDPEDAARYLYRYNDKALANVMDQEIRGRVESAFARESLKYYLKDNSFTDNYGSIIEHVATEVDPYFKDRGINITVLGIKGNPKWDDPKIQDAINSKFVSSQREQSAAIDAQTAKELQGSKGTLDYQKWQLQMQQQQYALETQRRWVDGCASGAIKLPTYWGGGNMMNMVNIGGTGK